MHIGMRLLHPAAADHSMSISRQQVQRIFSFSLRSRAVTSVCSWLLLTSEFNELSTLFGRLYSGGGSSRVEWTAHISLHYPLFVLQMTISPVRFSTLKEFFPKKSIHGCVFLKMTLHLANLTLRLYYKDELGLASDNMSPVRFWMRLLPGAGWMITIAASRAWAVSTLRWRSWMSHLLTVNAHLGVAARLRYLDKGAELLPPGCRQARSTSGGSTAGLRITVVANPQGTIAPLALHNQLSCQWNVLGPLKGAYQQYPWHSSRRPDVDRCIGGWAGASGEEDSAALRLRR